jgi:iron complex transport system ATP-binding protein
VSGPAPRAPSPPDAGPPAPAGEPALLAFEGVGVALGGRPVLADVSLALAPGEVVALVGPNGSGKTTLLRVASGVLAPAAGRVRLCGRELPRLSRRELARQLAVVPQDAAIPFPFSVAEVVLMGRSPHLAPLAFESRADVERAREAMARVGIEHLADRSVLELSGGERQLVLVARAFAQDPRVLLLDEPTAHLDLRHRLEVLARVREFAAGGRAALVVSHDLGLAARTSERLALLRAGRVFAAGRPEEVLTPQALREVFGVEAEVLRTPEAGLAVVARAASGAGAEEARPAAGSAFARRRSDP